MDLVRSDFRRHFRLQIRLIVELLLESCCKIVWDKHKEKPPCSSLHVCPYTTLCSGFSFSHPSLQSGCIHINLYLLTLYYSGRGKWNLAVLYHSSANFWRIDKIFTSCWGPKLCVDYFNSSRRIRALAWSTPIRGRRCGSRHSNHPWTLPVVVIRLKQTSLWSRQRNQWSQEINIWSVNTIVTINFRHVRAK